ncbi:MAG TPA: serine protease, partial [Chthonomonadaceae bacterium]|nr:serine protease [Chthonomonadaceae bacterium]
MPFSVTSRPQWGAMLCLTASLCAVLACRQARAHAPKTGGDAPPIEDRIPMLTGEQASDLEGKIQRLTARLFPSVVRIWEQDEKGRAFDEKGNPTRGGGSGVIISDDGLVLTCAHHGQAPNTPVTIELADGKRVPGVHLGRFALSDQQNTYPDLGMVRILERGKWPVAPIGPANAPEPGTLCLAIGYPGNLLPGRPPMMRLGRTIPYTGGIKATVGFLPGDSGGPLFDLSGQVLGVLHGEDYAAGEYQSVAPLGKHRKDLEAGKVPAESTPSVRVMSSSPLFQGAFAAEPVLRTKLTEAGLCAVQILDGVTPVAWGMAVDPDGWVVTKRTLVDGREDLNCRLSWTLNGDVIVSAKVVAMSVEHDLALLRLDPAQVRRINPNGLPVPQWADTAPRVGQLVATPLGWSALLFGVVGVETRREDPLPFDQAQIMLEVKAGPKGEPIIAGVPRFILSPEADGFRRAFKPGDVMTQLNGIPTPTLEEYGRVNDRLLYVLGPDGKPITPLTSAPGSLAGEPVQVTVLRNGKEVTIRMVRIHSSGISPVLWKMVPPSLRRDGFPAVFAHDGRLRPDQCGGPLL